MQFKWTKDHEVGRIFTGPPVDDGWFAGFAIGETRWAKRETGIAKIDDLDSAEGVTLYCILTMRRVDHTLLPIKSWEDVQPNEFVMQKHGYQPGRDADCKVCGGPASG